jgi:hypothetical protein
MTIRRASGLINGVFTGESVRPAGYQFPVGINILSQGALQTTDVLIVAGGGGGSRGTGTAGSGAGGLLYGSGVMTFASGTSYPVTVGAGGAAAPASVNTSGSVGNPSVFNGATAAGGGVGARNSGAAIAGGSGGGSSGASINGSERAHSSATQGPSASLTGYGNPGAPTSWGSSYYAGGGGGGAGAIGGPGGDAGPGGGGNGGAGLAYSISGSSVTYAGGGGGTREEGPYGTGGPGGGGFGFGALVPAAPGGAAGTANRGGGAGGSASAATPFSPTLFGGGSGIVVVSYPGAQTASGGAVTTSGSGPTLKTIHTFTGDGTFTTIADSYAIN